MLTWGSLLYTSFGIFSHPPSLMHCINSTHRDTNCLTSVINTMVEGVNGYGILTDIGTCLNHLKYPVTHNLISYRDYHQSLLLHMHSPLGGIKGKLRWDGHWSIMHGSGCPEACCQDGFRQTLFRILSKQKIFRYFMHMRAKTICGF